MIEGLARVLDEIQPRRILELGIAQGGSVALLAALAPEAKVVAIDIAEQPVAALTDFIERRGDHDRVRPYFGVDQGDTEHVGRLLDQEFGAEPIDLVIDDASHRLDLSRISFDLVFPRVRPGGCFVIEDWAWAHEDLSDVDDPSIVPDGPPLTALMVEVLMTLGTPGHVLDRIDVDQSSARLWRGSAQLPSDGWRLASSYHSMGPVLAPEVLAEPTPPT
jgi:cephalosporin hydroxylase